MEGLGGGASQNGHVNREVLNESSSVLASVDLGVCCRGRMAGRGREGAGGGWGWGDSHHGQVNRKARCMLHR